MKHSLLIGTYIPGQSLIHRLDPRTKFLATTLFLVIVFLANNIATYSVLAVFLIAYMALTKIPIGFIMRGLKPLYWVLGFTLLLHLFTTRGGDVLWQWHVLRIDEFGVLKGIEISVRFILLIGMSTMLTLTTTPIELTDAIETLFGPLKKLKLPIHEIALMMSISLRFIPTLLDEIEKIMKAQQARGANFSSGSIVKRVKALIPIFVPLFIGSFKRADELATAMEVRGYRGSEGRTKLRILQWNGRDTAMMLVLLGLTALLVALRQ